MFVSLEVYWKQKSILCTWLCFGIFHFCTTIIIIIEDITPYYKHLYRVSWCYYCIIEFTCNCEFSMKCINYIIIIHGHRLTSCALYHACVVMLDPIENPVLLLVYQYHCHWCALVGHPSTSNCAHSPLKLWLYYYLKCQLSAFTSHANTKLYRWQLPHMYKLHYGKLACVCRRH